MLIINPNSNGERAGQSRTMHEIGVANRRHAAMTRKVTAAQEAGLLERAAGMSAKNTKMAAEVLVQQVLHGKISRQQLEEEQRADDSRLKGWEVTSPMPGTPGADKLKAIRYRMAVRARALEQVGSIELGLLTSNHSRQLPGVNPKVTRKKGLPTSSFREAGGAPASSPARTQQTRRTREYNDCNLPGGGSDGGRFGANSDGRCGAAGGGGEPAGNPGWGDRNWSEGPRETEGQRQLATSMKAEREGRELKAPEVVKLPEVSAVLARVTGTDSRDYGLRKAYNELLNRAGSRSLAEFKAPVAVKYATELLAKFPPPEGLDPHPLSASMRRTDPYFTPPDMLAAAAAKPGPPRRPFGRAASAYDAFDS
jgi:hypothetical protein